MKRQLVLVEWVDACRHPRVWTDTEELADPEVNAKPEPCRSVGWVMSSDRRGVSLCPNLSGVDGAGGGTGGLFIPRGCIVRVRRIEVGNEKPGTHHRRKPVRKSR